MVLLIGTCCGEEFPHSRSFFSRGRRNIPAVIVTVINYLHVSFSVDGKKPKQTLLFSIQMFLFKFDVSTCYFKVDATNNDKSRLHLVFTRISKDRKHNSLSCRGFEIHIDQPFIFGLINNIEFLGRAVLSRKDWDEINQWVAIFEFQISMDKQSTFSVQMFIFICLQNTL